MGLIRMLHEVKLIPERNLLEVYPPFLFMGVKVVYVSKNYRHIHIQLPLRWYGKNLYGTMFGGFICAVSDPLPALLCSKLFDGMQVWTKSQKVEFLRPAKGALDTHVRISTQDISMIKQALKSDGEATHAFSFMFQDERGREIAQVENTVFIRRKRERKSG